MTSFRNKIIIVANEMDHPAARFLMNKLAEKYDIEAQLWTSDKFIYEEDRITNYRVFISIGGYTYNTVTEKYLSAVDKLKQTDEIYIGTKFKRAIVFGYQETESYLKAVKYFMQYNLDKFVKTNFPDIKKGKTLWPPVTPPKPQTDPSPPKPDTAQNVEKKPTKIVADSQTDYTKEPKYDKEFYEIDPGIWKLKYFDEETHVKDSIGLQYCYYVLSRPDRPISLTEIFCGVNDDDSNVIAPLIEGAVIDKNVNKTVVENLINDYNEKILLLERARLIILQEENALNEIFFDGEVDSIESVPTSKFDKEKEDERIKKAKELSLRYLNSMNRLDRELEAYEDIVKKLNEQLKYQPKEVSNDKNRYGSRIRMGFSGFYKLLKAKKLHRLQDYLDTFIDVYSGYIYHPNDDFTTWKLTK